MKKKAFQIICIVIVTIILGIGIILIQTFSKQKTNKETIKIDSADVRTEKIIYPWSETNLTDFQKKRFFSDDLHQKYKEYTDDTIKKDCIFISIASYRDKNCLKTVKDIYDKAFEPNKIYIGICTQNKDENNENCIDNTLNIYKNNIRQVKLPHTDALGPQYARFICSHLWDGEEYFLMIDSHLLFRKNWDKILKNMYKSSPSNKTIITSYPPSHEDKTAFNDDNFIYTCKSQFSNNFHIIAQGQIRKNTNDLWITPYASAGFFFVNYKWLYEVPFDPYLPYFFQGEEILLSIRSYTNGWDLFNPYRNIATHYYNRTKDKEPHFWEDNPDYYIITKLSNMRYYYIIDECTIDEVHPEFRKYIDYYGLGNCRTLDEYAEFSNMKLKENKIDSRCDSKYNFNDKKWEKVQ